MKQMRDEIALEKDTTTLSNPDDAIAERLANLKGVDVDVIKHPGKGLDEAPPANASELDDSKLHDHSEYTLKDEIVDQDDQDDSSLLQEVEEVNKDVSAI